MVEPFAKPTAWVEYPDTDGEPMSESDATRNYTRSRTNCRVGTPTSRTSRTAVRDLRVNDVPSSRVSAPLNARRLRVERSRNPVFFFHASPLAVLMERLRSQGLDPNPLL